MTKLTIELVPSSSWFNNVRSHVSPSTWKNLSQLTAAAAGFKCEICGGQGKKHAVECHEVWEYDMASLTQKLVGLVALCPMCHKVKHIGNSIRLGLGSACFKHLAKVNGWSYEDAVHYVDACFEQWSKRSLYEWTVDLSYLFIAHGIIGIKK